MEQWAAQYLLEHSDPISVFQWLKANPVKLKESLNEDREEFETALFVRNEPLIHLGLALYGSDETIGVQLYENGDETIKKAVAGGASVGGGFLSDGWVPDLLPEMLKEWNKNVLKILFSNEYLPDNILVNLFERTAPFDSLDEDKWLQLCAYTSWNDRLSTSYESVWMDGWDEYKYNLVFTSAWRLFDKLPQTPYAAKVLIKLGEKLVIHKPSDMNVMAVIEKWGIKNDTAAGNFEMARSYLANLIPSYSAEFKELKNSDDIALRKAYYRNLQHLKPKDVEDGFERDGKEFIDAALNNQHMFSNQEVRGMLKDVCWKAPDERNDMDFPNYFNFRCEYWIKQYPEWFKDDWTGELPFEEIEDKNEQLRKRVEYLNLQVNEIHKSLLGKDECPNDDKIETIEYLKSELEAIAGLLVKIHNKASANSSIWAWGIAGAAVGYAIAKL